jgi:5-formyltetrahydrofolate cyclo-ligase
MTAQGTSSDAPGGAGGAARTVEDEKAAARAALRAARRSLGADRRREASSAAAAHLVASPILARLPRGATVALYAACGSEADPLDLEQALDARGLVCAYPRVRGAALEFARARRSALVPGGPRRAPEPAATAATVPFEALGLVVLPGLGFTADGARLGQGGGFYDRALSAARARGRGPVTVGFAFGVQVVERLPTTTGDQPVDVIATEAGLLVPGRSPDGRRPADG